MYIRLSYRRACVYINTISWICISDSHIDEPVYTSYTICITLLFVQHTAHHSPACTIDTWNHTTVCIIHTWHHSLACRSQVYVSFQVCRSLFKYIGMYNTHTLHHSFACRSQVYGVAMTSRLLKIMFFFAEYSLFCRAVLQKRPIIFRSLLVIATP